MRSRTYQFAWVGLILIAACGERPTAKAGSVPFTLNGITGTNGVINVTDIPLEDGDGFFTGTATESVTPFSDSITVTGTAARDRGSVRSERVTIVTKGSVTRPLPVEERSSLLRRVKAAERASWPRVLPLPSAQFCLTGIPCKPPLSFLPIQTYQPTFPGLITRSARSMVRGRSRAKSPLALGLAGHLITAGSFVLPTTFGNASVCVPEPSAVMLLGIGMLGLVSPCSASYDVRVLRTIAETELPVVRRG